MLYNWKEVRKEFNFLWDMKVSLRIDCEVLMYYNKVNSRNQLMAIGETQ